MHVTPNRHKVVDVYTVQHRRDLLPNEQLISSDKWSVQLLFLINKLSTMQKRKDIWFFFRTGIHVFCQFANLFMRDSIIVTSNG